MSFEFHNHLRIEEQIKELSTLRYKNVKCLETFDVYEDSGEVGLLEPKDTSNKSIFNIGDYWKGYDKYIWLQKTIELDEKHFDDNLVGVFDFGITGGGNNLGFESLLIVNDEIVQALDSNHKEAFFGKDFGTTLDIKIRLWSGLCGGGVPIEMEHKIAKADLAILDFHTDKLYYLAHNAIETYKILSDNDPHKQWLLNAVVTAFNLIDFSYPGSMEFYESVERAYKNLDEALVDLPKLDVDVNLIGHTHIDVAWLWTLRHTREKCVRSFSSVNKLMDKYDNYMFLQTQAQLYDYIKNDYPDLYEKIKQRVKEGRWEPSGSTWVECDCNVVSGESIVRQVLYGQRFFEKEFDYKNDYLWLPDVFGYSWAMPQILKQAGINTFATTKISWNDTNTMPYDNFIWKGIDGTEINTHFISVPDPSSHTYTYNGLINPKSIRGVWDRYHNKDLNKDLLISYGYGDGGGGVNRDMLESAEAIKKMPSMPRIKSEFPSTYFKRLDKTLKENKMNGYLPTWDGELYLEYHRGTYTSQAFVKKANRQLEFLLKDTEMLCTTAMLNDSEFSYPKDDIYNCWKTVMTNQFHDIIPGTSIREVYEDCLVSYNETFDVLNKKVTEACKSLISEEKDNYVVFNSTSETIDGIVEVENENLSYVNDKGEILKQEGNKVFVENVTPLSFIEVKSVEKTFKNFEKCGIIDEDNVSTKHYNVSWDKKTGQLTSIFVKKANREILPKGTFGNQLQVFEDKPRSYPAWELECTIDNKMEICNNLINAVVVENNSIHCDIKFDYKYRNSTISQIMRLYSKSERIDFISNIDWQEREKLLKVAYPLDMRFTKARFDIQFGSIERNTTTNNSWDFAQFEVVGHKWADVYETGFGFSLLNDCKYGYDVKENVMRLTLLKSSNHPDHEADKGEHSFTYSIYPHVEQWYEGNIERESIELNNPLHIFKGSLKKDIKPLLEISENNIHIDTFKKSEDGNEIIVRFHEKASKTTNAKITTNFNYNSCELCNIKEEKLTDIDLDNINFKPFEIKTIKFYV